MLSPHRCQSIAFSLSYVVPGMRYQFGG